MAGLPLNQLIVGERYKISMAADPGPYPLPGPIPMGIGTLVEKRPDQYFAIFNNLDDNIYWFGHPVNGYPEDHRQYFAVSFIFEEVPIENNMPPPQEQNDVQQAANVQQEGNEQNGGRRKRRAKKSRHRRGKSRPLRRRSRKV